MQVVLLALLLASSPKISMECANLGMTQTPSVSGPNGAVAVLTLLTADDGIKDLHSCVARFELHISMSADRPKTVVRLIAPDDDWGRRLSLRLSGFSPDGRHVYGIVADEGPRPFTWLFDYDTINGQSQLADLSRRLSPGITAGCTSTLDVTGTADTGAIVLEQEPSKRCGSGRGLLNGSPNAKLQHLQAGTRVLPLYEQKRAPQ